LRVPDEGYSRNAVCALNLISTFLLIWNLVVIKLIGNQKEGFKNIVNCGIYILNPTILFLISMTSDNIMCIAKFFNIIYIIQM
jgi:hypothetical protein